MPYTVMIWLVDREHNPTGMETRENRFDPVLTPGASSGVTAPPAFDRLNYGFYETEAEAEAALKDLAKDLEKNAPVRVRSDHRTFLIPATRVHYAVCEEVVRPKDQMAEAHSLVGEVALGV
ncbi:MAG TPA: hypothetical protein VF756_04165 [Thermoanaerobaculia bacterium]